MKRLELVDGAQVDAPSAGTVREAVGNLSARIEFVVLLETAGGFVQAAWGPSADLRPEVGAEQGCLVVRDTESEGDTSGWNPREQAWLVDRGSVIFAVRPATEGMVRCEVWREAAAVELPHQVFSIDFAIEGALHVGDPSGLAAIELPHVRGERTVRVLVGDPGRDEVIHAAQPWTPDSDAVSLDESDDEKVPSRAGLFPRGRARPRRRRGVERLA